MDRHCFASPVSVAASIQMYQRKKETGSLNKSLRKLRKSSDLRICFLELNNGTQTLVIIPLFATRIDTVSTTIIIPQI